MIKNSSEIDSQTSLRDEFDGGQSVCFCGCDSLPRCLPCPISSLGRGGSSREAQQMGNSPTHEPHDRSFGICDGRDSINVASIIYFSVLGFGPCKRGFLQSSGGYGNDNGLDGNRPST
jgi:hypothetical protein